MKKALSSIMGLATVGGVISEGVRMASYES